MPRSTAQPLDLEIISLGAGFYDFGGDLEGSPGTTSHMFYRADRILAGLLLKEVPHDPALAAGSLVVNDRRILVLADNAFDRLMFVMNCIGKGARVETDGIVVVRDETVMALPRRLRIERRAARRFPRLLKDVLASPRFVDWHGNVIHAFNPSAAGVPWLISPGPVDILLFLESNRGGHTSVGRLPVGISFERLLRNVIPSQLRKGASFAKLHRLSRSAACWKMRNGEPERSFWHLERIAETGTRT